MKTLMINLFISFMVLNAFAKSVTVTAEPLVQMDLTLEVTFDHCMADFYYNHGGGSIVTCSFEVGNDPANENFTQIKFSESYTNQDAAFENGKVYVHFIDELWIDDDASKVNPQAFLEDLKKEFKNKKLILSMRYVGPNFDTTNFGKPVGL